MLSAEYIARPNCIQLCLWSHMHSHIMRRMQCTRRMQCQQDSAMTLRCNWCTVCLGCDSVLRQAVRASRTLALPLLSAVDKSLLAGDTFSNTALQNYSSVTVHFNISIDNTAWYPNLGSVVKTNHDRLSTIMRSMGYSVVSLCLSVFPSMPFFFFLGFVLSLFPPFLPVLLQNG